MRREKRERKKLTFFGVPFACIALVAVVFSHIGWLVENIARAFLVGEIDARFYILPFISAYGAIPFAFHAILRSPNDIKFFGKELPLKEGLRARIIKNVIAYIMMVLFVYIAELAVGNLWDKLFGVKLWDYRSYPLNFTRYTSLPTSLAFGTGGFILYKTVYKWLLNAFCNAPYKIITVLAAVLGILIILDTVNMILYMAVMKDAPMLWSIDLR